MHISKFLAKVIGIYFIIVSTAIFINFNQFSSYINNLLNDAPLMFVTGFFTLILGILMIVSHNIWQWNWRILITLVGWITLIKAISIIFYPQFIDKVSILFVQNVNFAYGAAAIDFILGLILCYCGFKRERLF